MNAKKIQNTELLQSKNKKKKVPSCIKPAHFQFLANQTRAKTSEQKGIIQVGATHMVP